MAYTAGNLALISSVNGIGLYLYTSDTDSRATVAASGYFNNSDDNLNLAADDKIMVVGDQGGYTLRVDTVSSGVVTTESGGEPVWVGVLMSAAKAAAGTSVWMVAPHDGVIGRIKTVLQGAAMTVADLVIGIELATVAVTGSSVTITQAASAAGDVDVSVCTALNAVSEDDAIEITSDAGPTVGEEVMIWVEIFPA